MAWLDRERTGIYQIGFSFGGKRFKRSLRTRDEATAEATLHRVEENIRLVSTGRLVVPPEADIAAFLISDGKITSTDPTLPKPMPLSEVFSAYLEKLPVNSLGKETLRISGIHMNHVVRILGGRKQLRSVTASDLQQYINTRSKETGKRKRPVSSATISKEIATFRTIWKWAKQAEFVGRDFPSQALRFPRQEEKLPFLTWEQIEQRIRRGIPDHLTENDYWDCLYLNTEELNQLLGEVEGLAQYEFLYPMCVMAAHTGARRSELCRSMREDLDFESGLILIREKKKRKGKETFRHVPMSAKLKETLQTWVNQNCSTYTFPIEHKVYRIRTDRRRMNFESVSPDEASDHLTCTLSQTKWSKIRGWHIFRHSFISNCASLQVDQRMIDSWVGHQTEEMRRRYRHLFPNSQRRELEKVFG